MDFADIRQGWRKLEKASVLIMAEVRNGSVKMLTYTLFLNLGLFGKSLQTSKRDG